MSGEANTNMMTGLDARYTQGPANIINEERDFLNVPGQSAARSEHEYIIARRAHQLAQEAYKRFGKDSVVELSPEQRDIIARQIGLSKPEADYFFNQQIVNHLQHGINPNLSQRMEPYLGHFNAAEDPQFERYMQRHHANISQPIFREGQRMLEQALPALDAQYALEGNFHGGHRHAARRETIRKFTQQAHDKALQVMGQMAPEYLRHLQGNRGQELNAAQLMGDTAQRQAAEERAVVDAFTRARAHQLQQEAARLGIGEAAALREEEHRQRYRNAEKAEHHEEINHPWNQIAKESAIFRGFNPQNIPIPAHAPAPPPMNQAAMGANALPMIASMMGMGLGKKEGGEVRHFDGGGSAALPPMMDKLLPAMHNTEMMQLQQHAQNLQNTHPNAANQQLGLLGAEMGASMKGPWGNFSRAYGKTIHNQQAIDQARYGNQIHNAEILNKIQSSRLDQQKMIMEHQKNLRTEAEQKRVHDSTIALNSAHAAYYKQHGKIPNIVEGHHIMIDPKTGRVTAQAIEGFTSAKNRKEPIDIGGRTINPVNKIAMTPQDQIQLKEIEKELSSLEAKRAPYESLERYLGDTTPTTGIVPYFTPRWAQGEKNLEYGRLLNDAVSSKIPPGRQTEGSRQFAQASKPTELDTPEDVIKFAQSGKQELNEQIEPKIFARAFAGYGIPPRITLGAYDSWVNDGKEGDFTDYLADILEGKKSLKLSPLNNKSLSANPTVTANTSYTPEMEARRQELERKRMS